MSETFVLLPGAKQLYTFDWSAEIPSASPTPTISSVSYVITPSYSPQVLNAYTTTEDFDNHLSSVGLTGSVSGETYQVTAACTLSNGEVIKKNITVRGYNG
jgi:hypothetical protein